MTTRLWALTLTVMLASVAPSSYAQEIETGWNFSLATGYGRMNNPLKAANDVHAYLLPNVRYYGERFYADNFSLGYSLLETPDLLIDLEGHINDDGLLFKINGLQHFFVTDLFNYKPKSVTIKPNINYQDIERNISYLAGLSVSFPTEYGIVNLGHYRDASGVHHGSESQIRYRHEGLLGPVKWGLELGMTYKDQDLVNYYYHLSKSELATYRISQSTSGTQNYHAKVVLNMPINDQWFYVTSLEQTWLGSGITRSLLIDAHSYSVFFAGVGYAF